MESIDNKGKEAATVPNSKPKEEPNASPKPQGDLPEKTSVENGSLNGGAEKKSSPEKENPVKEKSPVITGKPTEPTVGKQTNNKTAELVTKKSNREDKYSRRKDERAVDQVLRTLNSFETSQEKLDALVKKYSDIFDENRKLQTQTKNFERRLVQLEREKDSAQSEHSKAVLARSRLEGLCRELQRQNRAIKEESVLKIREEEEKRKEVSNKFQSTLAEITSLMQQNNEKNSKLRDDNIEMTTKFKSVCEQYELRVQQVEKISKQMQLEAQLADAKLAKAQLEAKAEKEIMLRDKQELLLELAQYQARAREQQQTELKLREQVELYTNKYDEFQTALSRSNEVFGGFKEEMDKMSKKIVKLEKETSTWKMRWEKSHQALLEMATDKQQRDAELSLANRQLNQLHKLCRTLTEERAKLMSQINAVGTPTDTAKEDKLAADIAEDRRKLNDTLDSLQSVILERELLHKQQLLEKQQQQLQVELQKHLAASTAEAKVEASDTKASEKSTETKVNETKQADAKAHGGKNNEASKKKGKKQKAGRQQAGKAAEPEELKSNDKEAEASAPPKNGLPKENLSEADVKPPSELTSAVEVKPEEVNEKQDSAIVVSLSNSVPSSTPVNSQTEIPIESKTQDVTAEPPTVTLDSDSKNAKEADQLPAVDLDSNSNKAQESQVPVVADLPLQPAPVPVSDSTGAPAFSYAAAVGSKPAEHTVVDKSQSVKTEEKPVVTESETALPTASSNVSSPLEAVNGTPKPTIIEAPVTTNEDVSTTPSVVSPPKKNKKRVGQPLGIKGRTASLFRLSKLFGCLKRQGQATQTHDTS